MSNHAKAIRDRIAADHPGATVRRRGRRFIEHELPDGKILWTGTVDYLHYGPSDDQEIDTAWQVAVAPNAWQFNQGLYSATARPIFNVGQILTFTHASGQTIDFQPQQLQWSNDLNQIQAISNPLSVVAVPIDAELHWFSAFGLGLDFTWTLLPSKLKMALTIPSLGSLTPPNATILAGGNPYLSLQFIFARSSGVHLWIDGVEWQQAPNSSLNTTSPIEFRSTAAGNALLWTWDVARAFDESHRLDTVVTNVRRQGNNLFVQVRLPWADLQAAEFPVLFDPTTDFQPATAESKDAYISDAGSGTYTGGNSVNKLHIGGQGNIASPPRDTEHVLIKFDISSIPSTATVTDSTMYWTLASSGATYADVDCDADAYMLRRSWTPGQQHWTNYATGSAWGTAGAMNTSSDIYSTLIGSVNIPQSAAVNTGHSGALTASEIQKWVDGTITNEGMMWRGRLDVDDNMAPHAAESSTAGYRPKLSITYTTGTHYTITAAQGSYTLTGQTAALKYGHRVTAAQGSFTYTGQSANLLADRDLAAAQGAYTYSGQTAALTADRLMAATQGSYTYTGQAAGLLADRIMVVAQGAYTYTGQSALLAFGYGLIAGTGSYTLTGQAITLTADRLLGATQGAYTYTGQVALTLRGYPLTAAPGSYTFTGQTAALLAARLLGAAQGAYTYTGQAATFARTYILTSALGSYTYTGQTINLLAARLLTATQGSYTYTGQDAGLAFGYHMAAAPGTYTYTGQSATLTGDRLLAALLGSYTYTGFDAGLSFSGTTYTLVAAQGSYTYTGQVALTLRGYPLTASMGSYTYTGQPAPLTVARTLAAAQGAYTYTGQAAPLLANRLLTAAQGTYTYTGQAIGLLMAYMLAATFGSYTYTGRSAILTYSEAESSFADVTLIDNLVYTVTITDSGLASVTLADGIVTNISLADQSRG